MKRISAFEQKIRDYVNNADLFDRYFEKYPDQWHTLCVAMDILGDSCLALEHYESYGIGADEGEKYLKLYGVLQGIFLQQDSMRQLYRTFLDKDLQPDSDSAWTRIRDLRNLSVGHPVEKKDKTGTKRCSISRVTIDRDAFTLMVWDKDEGDYDFEDVDLKSLYDSYKSEALGYLEDVHQAQVSKWGPLQEY